MRSPRHRLIAAIAGAVLGSGTAVAVMPPSAGATPVAKSAGSAACNQDSLQAQLTNGGSFTYKGSCTLDLTKTLLVGPHAVTLNGGGHAVVLDGQYSIRVLTVTGHLTLTGIEIAHGASVGANGVDGTDGDSPDPPLSNGAPGKPGGDGGAATSGKPAMGGGMAIAKGAVVTLHNDTFDDDSARAGFGGNGGVGGFGQGGASGGPSSSAPANGGAGGKGGDGGKGGAGASAYGGAIASAGSLTVTGGKFIDDVASAGYGGDGGAPGQGGSGGEPACKNLPNNPGCGVAGTGGAGGNQSPAGAGGSAFGGAIYSTGKLKVTGTAFTDDIAAGGYGGTNRFYGGGSGGGGGPCKPVYPCPAGSVAPGGVGGNGSNGGKGGSGTGGAIDSRGKAALHGVTFAHDSVTAGVVKCDTTDSNYTGCGGLGGAGGYDSNEKTQAAAGKNGKNGKPGKAKSPDATVTTKPASALKVITKSLPRGRVGTPYHVAFHASGGVKPYRWSGSGLPMGLSVSTAGVLHGTPKAAGTSDVVVKVTDPSAAQPSVGRATLTLRVLAKAKHHKKPKPKSHKKKKAKHPKH